MLPEVLEALAVRVEGLYVDATLGGGSYSKALLNAGAGRILGLDTDPAAHAEAGRKLATEIAAQRMTIVSRNFGELSEALHERGIATIDGIVYDLGVSSHQLDTSSIGLSYRVESPLDMRLDPTLGRSAFDVINDDEEYELRTIFRNYGEEPQAGRIARRIVQRRALQPIRTTTELATIVAEGTREDKRSALLSRIFQAIRIEVNDELGMLERSLHQAIAALRPGGRIVVVSYHSLEDRIVKQLFQRESAPEATPTSEQYLRERIDVSRARLKLITRKPIVPGEEEIAANPRARSAKLRAAEKV